MVFFLIACGNDQETTTKDLVDQPIDEARDLTKKLQKDLAESFSSGLNHAMGKVEELDKATTRAGKAQKKLYEDSIDLTKDKLENVYIKGLEEIKTALKQTKI